VRGQPEERISKRTTAAETLGAQTCADPGRAASGWVREELRPAEADPPSYRVRVRAVASPRTRTLTIEAATHEAARREALRYTGEGWRVIDVEAL
jgi:DNA-binding transcriptional regulator YdaS (Cro superfamily)